MFWVRKGASAAVIATFPPNIKPVFVDKAIFHERKQTKSNESFRAIQTML